MEDIFKISPTAASEFVSGFRLDVMYMRYVYISHRKYQVKPHLFPWFSSACTAAIAHRNLFFFRLYQQNKSSESKVKFRQASNCLIQTGICY